MNIKAVARAGVLFGLIVVALHIAPAVAQTDTQKQESTDVEAEKAAKEEAAAAKKRRRRPPAAYSKTGYIDSAIIGSSVRVRFDAAFDNTGPDRGEFFYAKCGCYREVGLDPQAPGPAPALDGADPATTQFIETGADFTDFWLTGEYKFSGRFSGFIDGLFRSVSPEVNKSWSGVGDVSIGFKGAAIANPSRFLTFQLKATLPTGDAAKGLGTDATWWEPGVLYFQEIKERATIAAEFRVAIPTGGSSDAGVPELTGGELGGGDFSSTVYRYGFGGSFDINPQSKVVVAPVVEFVGWTLDGGYATTTIDGTAATAGAESAETTIVNAKVGIRMTWGDSSGSVYVGWGTALTSDSWYENIVRAEYRHTFF